jgi:hypothetical protein
MKTNTSLTGSGQTGPPGINKHEDERAFGNGQAGWKEVAPECSFPIHFRAAVALQDKLAGLPPDSLLRTRSNLFVKALRRQDYGAALLAALSVLRIAEERAPSSLVKLGKQLAEIALNKWLQCEPPAENAALVMADMILSLQEALDNFLAASQP